ncbi:MAG: hypothetical protein ABW095_02005, partial [Candidatus Thiodiazotropha sp.]
RGTNRLSKIESILVDLDVPKSFMRSKTRLYSENYQPGAERIRVRDDQKKSALNTDQLEGQAVAEASGDYTDFEIVQPTNNETIRSADSSVSVGISLTPPLAEGHEIYLYVDGTKLKSAIKTTQLVLQNLVRGSHTLKAELQDGEGTVLRESPSISFNLRQEALE